MCFVTMKKKILLLATLGVFCLLDQLCYSSVGAEEVFYVNPTGSTTECPSGDSPCHSLQYYADHSNFTNNSRFLFLEGEHHLDSVVDIRNVANLSLVGTTSGVRILCKSLPSGLYIEWFTNVSFGNVAIMNCSGFESTAVYLLTGSEASLNNVTISTSSGNNSIGIAAIDIVGSFLIFSSTFSALNGANILVQYNTCNKPSSFMFSKNLLSIQSPGVALQINCSGVQVLINDSMFDYRVGLIIDIHVLTDNSVVISNSTFRGNMEVRMCPHSCNENSLQCGQDLVKLTRLTANSAYVIFKIIDAQACNIRIEDSTFSNCSTMRIFDRSYSKSLLIAFRKVKFSDNSTMSTDSVTISFADSTFENNTRSPIVAYGSEVIFQGSNVFRNNSAVVGGGMQLLESSYMYLQPNTSLLFEDNHAYYVGGAIYTDGTIPGWCFSKNVNLTLLFNRTIEVNFIKNTASFSGSSLYGGGVDNCCATSSCATFFDVFNVSNTETDPSAIASEPDNVCLCEPGKHQPNCSYLNRAFSTHAFPGQDFTLRLAVVSAVYFHGVVPGAIRAYFDSARDPSLGLSQSSQASDEPSCKDFSYSVSSVEGNVVVFKLAPEQSFFRTITRDPEWGPLDLTVTVYLKDCPLGFYLSLATGKCECDPPIDRNNIECNIDHQSILRPGNSWIGFINNSSTSVTGVMFHPNCPVGYCLPHDVNITSETSDSQCEPHRTGMLCGECQDGYSLTLGEVKCVKCSSTYLLIFLALAVAGLLLVAALFALNLTVTEGNINGLIFYANVIGMNYTVLFSEKASDLYTFIAWLNLDLGISTCLFDGMDGYAEAWLQFVFPVYLWIIILVIIKFYSKFPILARRGGKNAVKVLATLLLLSYTKLQRTVITIMSFTRLEDPGGVVRYVWLYDANLEFFKGKHLYLGLAGILVLVFLIVPYTLCLTFFQQLQACSDHRLFQWVNKLKPVFDAYAGPYKDKYRFWTGMLLVVRTLLIILFTINIEGSPDINLLIIILVSCTLSVVNSNGAYKKWSYNYLESFFYLQLVAFAAGVAYARHSDGSITAVANTSFGLSLVVFLAVVVYHVLFHFQFFKKCYYHLKGHAEIGGDETSFIDERAPLQPVLRLQQ